MTGPWIAHILPSSDLALYLLRVTHACKQPMKSCTAARLLVQACESWGKAVWRESIVLKLHFESVFFCLYKIHCRFVVIHVAGMQSTSAAGRQIGYPNQKSCDSHTKKKARRKISSFPMSGRS